MASDFLQLMIEATLSASLTIVLVAALRRPMRTWLGARPAYWLWLIVPLSVLAVLLPAPTSSNPALTSELPSVIADATARTATMAADNAWIWISVWSVGCLLAMILLVQLQRSFVGALGELQRDANGNLRSLDVVGPALVGAWRPRLVLPGDFEARYSGEEQSLVLAHEHAHLRRGDPLANALAACGICLFWFNPLIYWAVGRFRFDQELACDAEVLSRFGSSRRRYADAMLKTQLAVDAAWRLPVGCHWQACHPLKERISMLKRPLPSPSRRRVGTALVIAISVMASYAAWAASPAKPATEATALPAKTPQFNPMDEAEVLTPPKYPASAVVNGQAGVVVLEFLVASDGSVREARVVSSTPAGVFDQVSIDAVLQWKFKPGRLRGWQRVPINFSPTETPGS